MARTLLQEMVEGKAFQSLPANWSSFDLKSFSRQKRLWDYQQQAVASAVVALWKYYEDFGDFQRGENLDANLERKRRFFEWYQENELPAGMNLQVGKLVRKLRALLEEYYDLNSPSPLETPHPNPLPASGARGNVAQGRGRIGGGTGTAGEITFESIVNRMCFWMATGSGKTLVLVKLIEVLRGLILAGEIPPNDILVLTHREDLIEQLKRHVQEFNSSRNDLYIRLRELKEYAEAKRENPSLFGAREMTVFYYRSDNLSDEQKERIIDFRNYDDNGKWYVLLDEAHKGDKEDSKRQHIYSILARNGFLFNFSATFTDERDIVTTVCDFNLARFTQAGYGKHIAILEQEFRAFRDQDDYTGEEKQKIVLKSLMLLAYVTKLAERLRTKQPKMYHRPLLLTLVNSVNTEDADLKRFFRELERAGKGEVADSIWQTAKKELLDELSRRPAPVFESDSVVSVQEDVLRGLKPKDMLKLVFNASSPGEIEVLVRPSNRQELAFKLKTSERPFALIKIGDVSGWLKDELAGYEVNERHHEPG
ncbi:MAG TPA: DEAD/DEAH box helicase family protein [bacterium]|nr:DEAD/DEAH box helicase family protein [bacterium]